MTNVDEKPMSIWDHLAELRRRVIYGSIPVLIFSITAYFFRDRVMLFLMEPNKGAPLIFIHPAEAFLSYVKVSFFVGLLASAPLILYQIWKFALPALSPVEQRTFRFGFLFGGIMFYSGSAFAFYIALPAALRFLLAAGGKLLDPQLTVGNYVSFVTIFAFIMGLVFELPLVVLILVRLEVVSLEFLKQRRRHVIVLTWIAAAILTPPDIVTQAFMAIPLMLLYEFSLLLAAFIERRRKRRLTKEGSEDM